VCDYEKGRRFSIDERIRAVLPPQICRSAASTKANRITRVRPISHHAKGKSADSRLITTIRVQPAETISIRHPTIVLIPVRDYSRHGGKKSALVVSIADPSDPHKGGSASGSFQPSIPVENGCRLRIHWTSKAAGIKLVNNAAMVGVMPCLNSLENQLSPPTPSTRFPALRLGPRLN
jgi:hypothetical protein